MTTMTAFGPLALLAPSEMGLGAWVFLVGTWGAVIALNVFCFARIFSKKRP